MMGEEITQSGFRSPGKLAAHQHGVVSRQQLLAADLSAKAIEHRLATGRLHGLMRGVYAVGRAELTQYGHWMAAVLACGSGAVLSHRSAAELWRICRWIEGWIEITVPVGCDRRPAGLAVHRRQLKPTDVCRHEGIPVTTPVRTLLDLAGIFSTRDAEAALNEAVKLDIVDWDEMSVAVADMPPVAGKGAFRKLLGERTFRLTDSDLERRFLRLVERAGLPPPETGRVLHGFKTDFSWPELGLVVETDGLRFHRTPSQQARDRLRDQTLTC